MKAAESVAWPTWLGGRAAHSMEPGPESRQFGRGRSQETIQIPCHGSEGPGILRLVRVS